MLANLMRNSECFMSVNHELCGLSQQKQNTRHNISWWWQCKAESSGYKNTDKLYTFAGLFAILEMHACNELIKHLHIANYAGLIEF